MENKWITIRGKKEEVVARLQEVGIPMETAKELIAFLMKEKNILSNNEVCEIERNFETGNGNVLGFLLMDCNYYLNIKVGTAFLLSLLIDNKIGLPVVSGGLTIRGMNRLIEKIDECSGMKCVLLELLRLPNKTAKEDILNDFNGECCNNHLECRFRNDGRCTCTTKDSKDILEQLADVGIVIKEGESYRYSSVGVL